MPTRKSEPETTDYIACMDISHDGGMYRLGQPITLETDSSVAQALLAQGAIKLPAPPKSKADEPEA